MRIESVNETMGREEGGIRRELDLAHVGRVLSRRKLWVLAPVLVCFLGAVVGVNVIKPRFTAEAKILIENQENFFTRPDRTDRDTVPLPDDEAIQSQVQLVSSRDIARSVLKSLNLEGNAEFDPIADGLGAVTRLMVLLGLEPNPLRATPQDRMLSAYYDRLNVYPIVKSRVLSVQFTSLDPDLAAKAANTIADDYIDLQSEAKRDAARSAATSLASLNADLRVKLAAAETKAQEYRAANGLLVGTNNTTITSQQLSDLTSQLAQSRSAEADAQAKAKILRDMIKANRIGDVPDVANSDLIRRISDQRITLKAQIAQQAMTLLPGHPRMQELNAQLADIENQLRAAGEKTVRTLENDSRIAAARVENLQNALDGLKQTASVAGTDSVTLRGLEQQASLLKDQLDFNTQKYQEAVARENAVSTPADARVISRAIAPELPTYPKKLPTIAIVTLAGLILSIGITIARELLSGRAFVAEGQPGALPIPLKSAPEEAAEEDFAALRPTLVEEASPAAHGHAEIDDLVHAVKEHETGTMAVRLLVTGADDAVPVMTAALTLARALAREARVILVDCGAKPDVLHALVAGEAEEPVAGLGNLLAGTTTFAEVIHRDPASRLHLVPYGAHDPLQEDGSFDMLVDALAETYDRVILAAPVPAPGQGLCGIDRADVAVLLVSPRHTVAEIDACRAALYAAGSTAVYTLDAEPADAQAARTAA
jgi:uncharacterized protein involved in exopolysaccharide biosynthesis/Mrp family chromosome partitioning ATPase